MRLNSFFARKSAVNFKQNLKRTLKLESLEERQLLTASPLTDELTIASTALFSAPATNNDLIVEMHAGDATPIQWDTAVNETPSTVVDSASAALSSTDGKITLLDAISYAGNTYQLGSFDAENDNTWVPGDNSENLVLGSAVSFAGTLGSSINLSFDSQITVNKAITIDAGSNDVTITVTDETLSDAALFSNRDLVTLTAGTNGRIRLINSAGTIVYDSKWETPDSVVTTTSDVVDNTDGLISLREAIGYVGTGGSFYNYSTNANTASVSNNITFAADFGTEGETIQVEFSTPIVLTANTTIDAGSKDIQISNIYGNAFDETNGIITLLADSTGRIRLLGQNTQLPGIEYDSNWEFRNMETNVIINSTDGFIGGLTQDSLSDGNITLVEAVEYAGQQYREYAWGNTTVTLSCQVIFDDQLEGGTVTLLQDLNFTNTCEVTLNGIGSSITLDCGGYNILTDTQTNTAVKGLNITNFANIENRGNLSLENDTISGIVQDNTDVQIDNNGQLDVNDSTFSYTEINNNRSMTVRNTRFSDSEIINNGTAIIEGSNFNASMLKNTASMSLTDAFFTGEVPVVAADQNSDDSNSDDSASDSAREILLVMVENEGGNMTLQNVVFSGINIRYETFPHDNHDELNIDLSAALIANDNGTLNLNDVDFINNSLFVSGEHGDVKASFAAIANHSDGENMVGAVIINRSEIYGNNTTAWSTFGFANALFAGLYNINGDAFMYNSIVYGNTASASNAIETTQPSQVVAIHSDTEDVTLTNDTILQTISLNRARAIVNNTIYADTQFNRGFIDSRISGNNLCVDGKDVSTLFVAYNAQTGLFNVNENNVPDYRIFADAFVTDGEDKITVINAGNNDALLEISNYGNTDVRDMPRIHNEIVDIGAVESQAIDLTADLLGLDAQAAPLETPAVIDGEAYSAGLTSIICTWDKIVDGADYYLRFKTQTSEADWTQISAITDDGLTGSGNGFTWTVVCQDGLFICTIEGMTPKTWYDFQILGNGDNIEYFHYDPENLAWPETTQTDETVSETTRERLYIPTAAGFDRAPRYNEVTQEHSINIGWKADPRAVGYYITYQLEGDSTINEEVILPYDNVTNPTGYIVKSIAGNTVVNYTIHNLEEGSNYTITIKALSYVDDTLYVENTDGSFNTYVLNSDTVTISSYTKTILDTPEITADQKGYDSATSQASTSLKWTPIFKTDGTETSSYQVTFVKVDDNNTEIGSPVTIIVSAADAVDGYHLISNSLTPGAKYQFTVRAYEPNSVSYVSSPYSAPYYVTMLKQLDAPVVTAVPEIVALNMAGSDTTFSTNSTTSIDVAWNIPTNGNSATLEYSADGINYTNVYTGTDTGYTVEGLTVGTQYWFRITISGDENLYVQSSTVKQATTAIALSTPVLSWSNAVSQDGSAQITWDAIDHASGYRVNGVVNTTAVFNTEILDGNTSEYFVYAAISTDPVEGVYYAWSSPASIELTRADAPSNLSAVASDASNIKLSWTGNQSAGTLKNYKVQYRVAIPTTSNNWSDVSTEDIYFNGTNAFIRNLDSGTSYEFRVCAITVDNNAAGETSSAYSESVTCVTKKAPAVVTEAAAVATQTYQIDVSWQPSEEADNSYYYVVECYQGSTLVQTLGADKSITGTTCTFNGLTENMLYDFKIYSYSTDTTTLLSPSAAVLTSATTWAKMDISANSSSTSYNTVELNWNDDNEGRSDLAGYTIEWGNNNSIDIAVGNLQTTIGNLTEGETYTFTIYARNADGNVISTADSVSVTARAHLAIPANVTATPDSTNGTSTIIVTWDLVANATGYNVTCASGIVSTITYNGSTASAKVSGLTNNTQYAFTVTAKGGTVGGVIYTDSAASTNATTWLKLTAPTFTAGSAVGKEISLTWQPLASDAASSYIEDYIVQVWNGSTWTQIYKGTNTNCSWTGTNFNTKYSFRVMAESAQGDDGDSSWSSSSTANAYKVSTQEQLDVLNFAAVAESTTKIQLSWDELLNANGDTVVNPNYTIQYKESGADIWSRFSGSISTLNGTCSTIVTGLNANTQYTFTIVASASGYVDSQIDTATAKTNAVVSLGNLNATASADGQAITVQWDALSNVDHYTIVCTNANGATVPDSVQISGNSYTFTGLQPGYEYNFTVTAVSSSEDYSDSSDTCSATTDSIKLTASLQAVSTPNGIDLSWNAVDNSTGYTLRYKQVGSTTYTSIDMEDVNFTSGVYSITVTGLTSGQDYQFELVALGDGTHYTDSDVSSKVVCAPAELILETFTVENPSDTGTRPSAGSNLQNQVIDEWTPVYLEVWANSDALYDGLVITLPISIHDQYQLDLVHSNNNLDGLDIHQDNNGNWVITVESNFDPAGADSLILQLRLIPRSQENNGSSDTKVGVPVGTAQEDWKPVAIVDGVEYTDVKPVPFDLDDNGYVGNESNPLDWDYNLYTGYTNTDDQYLIDFNGDEKICDQDKEMMRTNNGGKSLTTILNAGENWAQYRIDYTIVSCNCTDETPAAPVASASALPAMAFAVESVMEEEETVVTDDFVSEFSIELAQREIDTMPYVRENNRMTSGVILKKSTSSDEKDTESSAKAEKQLDASSILDQIWAKEDINWRFLA